MHNKKNVQLINTNVGDYRANMRNTYFTSYFPLISIILFSISSVFFFENQSLIILRKIGLYDGLLEFFSGTEIKLTILFLIFLLFFMMLSAIKLISDTNNGANYKIME